MMSLMYRNLTKRWSWKISVSPEWSFSLQFIVGLNGPVTRLLEKAVNAVVAFAVFLGIAVLLPKSIGKATVQLTVQADHSILYNNRL